MQMKPELHFGVTMRSIVYTRPDGGVSVCRPSMTALRFMTNGGGRWDSILITDPNFLDRQIQAQATEGVREWASRRFVMAMHKGGCTDAEAYEIMRDRYCSHIGTGCELWDDSDLPDRWFRNAWRRSHNGGPITIDLSKAKRIQYARIKNLENKGYHLKLSLWRERIRQSSSLMHLRSIWPVDIVASNARQSNKCQ
jgi:hypothetical protein